MIRRPRAAAVAAIALLGLLVGGFLASRAVPPPPRRVPIDREPVRPRVLAERPLPPASVLRTPVLPSPGDTGTEPVAAAPPPAAKALDWRDRLPTGPVRCQVLGDWSDLEITLLPPADALAALVADGDPAGVAMVRDAIDARADWTRSGDEVRFPAVVGSPTASFTGTFEESAAEALGAPQGVTAVVDRIVELSWDAGGGRCVIPVDFSRPDEIEVSGRVEGLLEDERAWVTVCGRTVPVGFAMPGEPRDPTRFAATVPRTEQVCAVSASRRDGRLTATSPPLYIDPDDGDVTGLVLALPQGPIGGIGVPVGPHPSGMIVQAPTPGSPAELAGLEEGDVIVAVDGDSLAGLDLYESIYLVTGPVGSTVELTVQLPGGDRQIVRMERRAIE